MNTLRRYLKQLRHDRLWFEAAIIFVIIGLTCMIHLMEGFKLVILNLFYLPVALSGFFLGRYKTGVLALLGVIAASLVASQHFDELTAQHSPLVIALGLTAWAATLGLTALLVGTLSDEITRKQHELHEAYVGVVDVLSKYLQSANPRLKARSTRVAELSHAVATELRLSPQQTDDIRVAALMQDLEKIEVTTRMLTKAVDSLEAETNPTSESSFQGLDLVHSLGTVLKGAIPLLLNPNENGDGANGSLTSDAMPLGAHIIRLVRAYDGLTEGGLSNHWSTPTEALQELRRRNPAAHDAPILEALERVANAKTVIRMMQI